MATAPVTPASTTSIHVGYIALILVASILAWVVFDSWRLEHDQRIVAQQTVKADEVQIKDLAQQLADLRSQNAASIAALQKQASAVKTPAQAIAAIPDVSTLPLHTTILPSQPTGTVTVDALALYQELNSCSQARVNADSCSKESAVKDQIIAQKDDQIKALKKKPSVWKRVKSSLEMISIALGIGVALGLHL